MIEQEGGQIMGAATRFAVTGIAVLTLGGGALATVGAGSAYADSTYVVQASSSGWGQAVADARCNGTDQAVDGYGSYDGPDAYLSDGGSDGDGGGWYTVAGADGYVSVTSYVVCATE